MKGAKITNSFSQKRIKLLTDGATEVSAKTLNILLWHNNPRNISNVSEERPLSLLKKSHERVLEDMRENKKIGELVRRILSQGWQDNGDIMVGFVKESGKYFMIEGNRRLTALIIILEDYLSGSETMQQYTHPANLENFYKDFLENGINCTVANSSLTNNPPEEDPGDAETWNEETWVAIRQWLSNIHITGKDTWGTGKIAVNIFNDYMLELSKEDPNVNSLRIKDFYLDDDVIQVIMNKYGLSISEIKDKIYTVTLKYQIEQRLIELGGTLPKDSTSIFTRDGIQGLMGIKNRYDFNKQHEGRLGSGEWLDKFISLHFDYPGNERVIDGVAKSESSMRDYNSVIKQENDPDEKHIKMIEEDKKPASEALAALKFIKGEFKVITILETIEQKLEDPSIRELKKSHLDDDRLVELLESCSDKFDVLKDLIEKVR